MFCFPRAFTPGCTKVRWPVIGLARRVTYLVDRNRRVKMALHSEFDVGSALSASSAVGV